MATLADLLGSAYILVSIASVFILRIALSNRDKSGSKEFALWIFGFMVMGSATGVQFIANSYQVSAAAWNVLILGADFISIGWFLFAVEFTNSRSIPRSILAFLGSEIVVVQALAWTNPWHHLALRAGSYVDAAGFHHEVYGPVFWFHAGVAYAIIIVGLVLLLREFLNSHGIRREQVGIFLGIISVPFALNLLYVFRLQPLDFTLTPIGFFIAELGIAWALYQAGFLDLVPIGRNAAIQEMGDAFITLDGENRVVDYNEAAGELFDVDPGTTGLTATDFFGPYGESLDQPGNITDLETEITLEQDGEDRHYNLSVSPVRGGAAGGGGHVIVLSDVTPLIQREQELERTTARLDQFASTVSHDLRNPLNVAQGRLDLARNDCDSEHLAHVAKAHERMESLIDDVLTLARAGDAVREKQAVELADVVQGCWQHVETGSAHLVTETNGVVLADESRLQQLFENLFRNAVEHGRNDVTVTVGDLTNGFYVADDGPGIPEEVRDEVLEPGFSTNEEGTGFGLSIVRDIAEAHDWDIHITEADNGGARFEFSGVELE